MLLLQLLIACLNAADVFILNGNREGHPKITITFYVYGYLSCIM